MIRIVTVILVALGVATATVAQRNPCEQLDHEGLRMADAIMASEYLYDCCDDTISRCLETRPTCRLAIRLADDVCRRVAAGQDEEGIRRALSRRARSMIGETEFAEVDVAAAPVFGRTDAPVTVVIYACARCPYCSKLIPELYESVDNGALEGDARLVFRIFPIRGHEGSTDAGLGFEAAADMGGFWPFMLYSYGHFAEYSADRQTEWAKAVGLDVEDFITRLRNPATREELVESKKEGLVNGVEETPTLFLNGRRWVGDLEFDPLVDAIEEEAERVRGDLWATD